MQSQLYKIAIFDCDGVILNSNRVKSDAFAMSLPDEDPVLVDKFVTYHKENGGISRYVKFEYFFSELKKQQEYKSQLAAALDKYADICKQNLLECEEIPGVINLLEKFNNNNVPCYVVSGGDQGEVRYIFEKKSLTKYFRQIYGSPITKMEHLTELQNKNALNYPGVYFGDAKSDFDVSKRFDLDFVFVSGYSEWKDGSDVCLSSGERVIQDFNSELIF